MSEPLPDELKPCPFCGKLPTYRQGIRVFSRKQPGMVVYCETVKCPLASNAMNLKEWNARTADDQLKAAEEVVRHYAADMTWGTTRPDINCPDLYLGEDGRSKARAYLAALGQAGKG